VVVKDGVDMDVKNRGGVAVVGEEEDDCAESSDEA